MRKILTKVLIVERVVFDSQKAMNAWIRENMDNLDISWSMVDAYTLDVTRHDKGAIINHFTSG